MKNYRLDKIPRKFDGKTPKQILEEKLGEKLTEEQYQQIARLLTRKSKNRNMS